MAQQQPQQQQQNQQQAKPRSIDWSGDVELVGIWVPHTHMLQNAATSVTVGARVQAGTIEGIVKSLHLMRNGNVRCEVAVGVNMREKNPGKPRYVVFTPPFYAAVAELTE